MLLPLLERVKLSDVLVDREAFAPFARYDQRAAWEALAADARAYYRGLTESMAGVQWPMLPASLYMDFARNGNRSRYEAPYFQRRAMLYTLLVAECIEGKGRLIDDIINGCWAICEESTWVLPAHNNLFDRPGGRINALVDLREQPVLLDLFAAETASLLSWVYSLLGKRLAEESPLILPRIEMEIRERIFRPYRERDDFFWMGLAHDDPVNNWSIWINSNVLAAVLNVEGDPGMRVELVGKLCRSVQRFIDCYALDGGCDEGPGYFNVAGASLLDTLELLYDATNGAISLYDEPKIQNIGKYIMRVHIGGTWHVNFADAPARVQPDAMLLRRSAERTGQPDLAAYAEGALAQGYAALPYQAAQGNTYRRLRDLFDYEKPADKDTPAFESPGYYFPSIQVATARSHAPGHLFFAAKGGHNAESHNHNDIGNYIVAVDGRPLIVDAGVEVYTKKTFSAQRYEIWTMQSGYHNTAILNGCDQQVGAQYRANAISYQEADDRVSFQLDMAAAYPPEAKVAAYLRAFQFDRNAQRLTVTDTATLPDATNPTILPILSAVAPAIHTPGSLAFSEGDHTLLLHFDAALFAIHTEEIPIDDPNLLKAWKAGTLYRTLLTRTSILAQDTYTLTYTIP